MMILQVICVVFILFLLFQARSAIFGAVQWAFSFEYLDYLPTISIHAPKQSLLRAKTGATDETQLGEEL